jgi:nucleotide-binding universal stress UspA family protein
MRDSTTTQLPIVVGIDGSQAAIQAAEWAVDEAVSREVPLRLVAVIPQQAEPAPLESVGNVRMEPEFAETALRVQLAVIGSVDTDQVTRLIGPRSHPVLGHAECSVLIVRS